MQAAGLEMSRVRFLECPTNDTWARDHGVISLIEEDEAHLLDFMFNGWGLKFPADLDNLIEEVYQKPFEFVAVEEASNYSKKAFYIKRQELGEWDKLDLGDMGSTNVILTDMCNKGLIPEGNYLVDVFW